MLTNCKISQSLELEVFLIHINPCSQSPLSDQKTSRCLFCVHRGVSVINLAAQYSLYFHSRMNYITECPQTPRVSEWVREVVAWRQSYIVLLCSVISRSLCSVERCTCQDVTMRISLVQSLRHYCSNTWFLEQWLHIFLQWAAFFCPLCSENMEWTSSFLLSCSIHCTYCFFPPQL